MTHTRQTRREFVRNTSLAFAGLAGGLPILGQEVMGSAQTASQPSLVDTSKILNYNENMEYRRLGKTGLEPIPKWHFLK